MKRSRLTDAVKHRLAPHRPRRHRRTGGAPSQLPTAAEQLEVRTLLSSVPVLVQDINPDGSSNPGQFTDVNGTLFFTADDGANGQELWKYDGTTTELVADIRAGSDGSSPGGLTNVNGTLFFTANDGANGEELWKTDGTNTELVKDIRAGSDGSLPRYLTNVNGTLFFAASDDANGRELWKSDGTTTELVEDIRSGSDSSSPRYLTNVNGTLFFRAFDDANGWELWKSDGITTELVGGIRAGSDGSYPLHLTNVNGTLFFTAVNDANGEELWKSDGTTTELVADIRPGSANSEARELINVNGTLFFRANDGANGRELWKSDGTTTELVADIRAGSGGSYPNDLTNVNGTLFFRANDGIHGPELWRLVDNHPPTAVALVNTTPTLAENTDTSTRIKVGEIVITDDAVGTNTLSLTGTDAAFFEIDGTDLFLKANTPLDFETQATYDVTVQVDDTAVGSTPDATTDFTLTVTDVNEAPIAVLLGNILDTIEENSNTSAAIKVADIIITDDALGTNTLTLSGADAASFEIIGTELFLRAGVTLDFDTQTTLDVTVNVIDTDLGSGPHATTDFTLNITDVDERPPLVHYVWSIFGWKVQTVRSYVPWLFRR